MQRERMVMSIGGLWRPRGTPVREAARRALRSVRPAHARAPAAAQYAERVRWCEAKQRIQTVEAGAGAGWVSRPAPDRQPRLWRDPTCGFSGSDGNTWAGCRGDRRRVQPACSPVSWREASRCRPCVALCGARCRTSPRSRLWCTKHLFQFASGTASLSLEAPLASQVVKGDLRVAESAVQPAQDCSLTRQSAYPLQIALLSTQCHPHADKYTHSPI